MNKIIRTLTLIVLILSVGCKQKPHRLRIAVASNFAPTLNKIATEFTKETGIPVTIIPGSTGKLYTQIQNGAPYDIFLAADQERPKLLIEKKMATGQFTYAVGQLALWSAAGKVNGLEFLESDFERLAIANPKLAPYGRAARQTLVKMNLWDKINHRLVIGENVSQALEFARSENATAAFVSFSQVKDLPGSLQIILQKYHEPIIQDGCIIKKTYEAEKFTEYMKRDGSSFILADGYLDEGTAKVLRGGQNE